VDDETSLGDAVVRLLGDPELRARLGAAASAKAAMYDAPAIVRRFEALFRETLALGLGARERKEEARA
jgi:glycosyltransferase involved in cell wall biosynthesis